MRGWRKVNVRETKTAVDLAHEIKELLDGDYPDAETVVVVWDNLNTHTPASLYAAFAPPRHAACSIAWKSITPPKHGSRLDVAEIELTSSPNSASLVASAISRHCDAKPRLGPTPATLPRPGSTGSSPTTRRASNSSTCTRKDR